MKSHYSLFTIHHSRYVLVVLFFVLSLFMVNNAQAGIIVKAPAYLGLTRGLVGCWNFDGAYTKAPDCSGNNNTGTITGATKATGKVGQALRFDGVDDQVTVSSILGLGAGNVTISTWVNVADALESGAFVRIGDDVSGFDGYAIGVGNGDMNIDGNEIIGIYENVRWIDTNTTLGVGWHHVVMVLNSSGHPTIYLDGALIYSDTIGGPTAPTAGQTNIGGYDQSGVGTRYANQDLDDVRIYNRALPANEVARLYRIGLGSTANRGASASPLDKGLITHWTFDAPDISGTRAKDRSGKEMHGTLTNSPVKKAGISGQALYYDTANLGYVTVAHNAAVYGGLASGSFSFWAKIDTFNQVGGIANVTIAKNAGGSNNGDVSCGFLSTSKHRCNFDDGATAPNFDTVGTCSSGTWCHITYTWASGLIKVYLNGNFDNSESRSSSITPLNSSQPFSSGFSSGTTNGIMDDVRVYNRALSAGEVARLYNQTKSRANSSKTGDVLTKGLVGHWTFDGPDISGTRAKDSSGSQNHGIITASNTSPEVAIGKIGQAIDFKDTNDNYVVTANAVTLSNGTISAWIKYRVLNANEDVVVTFNGAGGCAGAAGVLGRSPGAGFTGNGFGIFNVSWKIASTGVDPILGVWYHILGTWGSGGIKFYENGVFKASDPDTSGITGQKLTMGVANCPDDLQGVVDDVRLYNRALSAGEVNKLYQMGR